MSKQFYQVIEHKRLNQYITQKKKFASQICGQQIIKNEDILKKINMVIFNELNIN